MKVVISGALAATMAAVLCFFLNEAAAQSRDLNCPGPGCPAVLGHCTARQVKKLKEEGWTRSDIRELCSNLDEDEDGDGSPPRDSVGNSSRYCCDAIGRKWCPIVQPTERGSPCICPGIPGTGIACD